MANAISSFKWRKISQFIRTRHLPDWIIWWNNHLPQTIFPIVLFLNFVELAWNHPYTGVASQGLTLCLPEKLNIFSYTTRCEFPPRCHILSWLKIKHFSKILKCNTPRNERWRCRFFIVWYQVWTPIIGLYILPPGHWTCSFVCHSNSPGIIQSCSRFGALNLSYTLPSLSYQVLILTWVKWSI